MTTPEILEYELNDQARLEAFFSEVWQKSRFTFDPEGAHSDVRRIPTEYQTNGGGFWLLRLAQQILGTVAIRRLPENVAEVKRLNVIQHYRCQGYGDRLLRHALAHAAATGYDRVRLDTVRNLGPALRLFKKYGFLEIPRYNDNPDVDLFMEHRLKKNQAGPFTSGFVA